MKKVAAAAVPDFISSRLATKLPPLHLNSTILGLLFLVELYVVAEERSLICLRLTMLTLTA